jgi:hypothetical protein
MTADQQDVASSDATAVDDSSSSDGDDPRTSKQIVKEAPEAEPRHGPDGFAAHLGAESDSTTAMAFGSRLDATGEGAFDSTTGPRFGFEDWAAAPSNPGPAITGAESDSVPGSLSGAHNTTDVDALLQGTTLHGAMPGSVEAAGASDGGPDSGRAGDMSQYGEGIVGWVGERAADWVFGKALEEVVGDEAPGIKAGDGVPSDTDMGMGGDTDPQGFAGVYVKHTSTTAVTDGGGVTRTTTTESFGPNPYGSGGGETPGINDANSYNRETSTVTHEDGTQTSTTTTTENYDWGTQHTESTQNPDGSVSSTTVRDETIFGTGSKTTTSQMETYNTGETMVTATVDVRDTAGNVTGTETTTNTYDSSGDLVNSTTTTEGQMGPTAGSDDPSVSGGVATAGDSDDGSDDDGSDDDGSGDDPDDGGTGTAMTTGEGEPLSAHEKAALSMLGALDPAITRAPMAGPESGQGVPGDDGGATDGGGGDGGGRRGPLDGVLDPMEPDGPSVQLAPVTVNAPTTAGPDLGPTIPGSDNGAGDPGGTGGGTGGGMDGGGMGPIAMGAEWARPGGSDASAFGSDLGGGGAIHPQTTGGGATASGRDPSTISGSDDDDLEDLEVQRDHGPTGGTRATTSTVGQTEDEPYLGMTTGDTGGIGGMPAPMTPHSALAGMGLDTGGAPATDGTTASGARDPSTISGSDDDDLEDLEVQRDHGPTGGTHALTLATDDGTPGASFDASVEAVDAPLELSHHDPAAGLQFDAGALAQEPFDHSGAPPGEPPDDQGLSDLGDLP